MFGESVLLLPSFPLLILQLDTVSVDEEDFSDTADAERGGVVAVKLLEDELAE